MTHVALEQAIAKVPRSIQSELRTILAQHAVIDSSVVASWIDRLGTNISTLMIQLLPVAATYARVPISQFYVGAIALGKPQSKNQLGSGTLYFGADMEFVGQALSFSVHAEQSATINAWLHGETGLQALAIHEAPCGYCRQFLYEMATVNQNFVLLVKSNESQPEQTYTSNKLPHFLPEPFGPADLGLTGGLMQTVFHDLETYSTDDVVLAALSAANQSYAPYTKNFCRGSVKRFPREYIYRSIR